MGILKVVASDKQIALAIALAGVAEIAGNPLHQNDAIYKCLPLVEGKSNTRVGGCNLYRVRGGMWSLSPHHIGEDVEALAAINAAKKVLRGAE